MFRLKQVLVVVDLSPHLLSLVAHSWTISAPIGIAFGICFQDIFGHIVEFGDQHGSRFIFSSSVAASKAATDEEKQHVFDEIVPTKTTQTKPGCFRELLLPS